MAAARRFLALGWLVAVACALGCVASVRVTTQVLEARQLFAYRAYKDVQIFQYSAPEQASLGIWSFKANISKHCNPEPVYVYLQFGSYPVVNPDNATFPDHFYLKRQRLHNLTLLSDSTDYELNITSPNVGDWFAVAFIWDEHEKILQKDLFIPCESYLRSTVKFDIQDEVVDIVPNITLPQRIQQPSYYRFYAPHNAWLVNLSVAHCSAEPRSSVECPITVFAASQGLPSLEEESAQQVQVSCSEQYLNDSCHTELIPRNDGWNYLYITFDPSVTSVEFKIRLQPVDCPLQEEEARNQLDLLKKFYLLKVRKKFAPPPASCWKTLGFKRVTLSKNFQFGYKINTTADSFNTSINISTTRPSIATFQLFPVVDLGGTLQVHLSVDMDSVITESSNITVIGCLSYGVRPTLEANFSCGEDSIITVNTTSEEATSTVLYIPYPETGTWYLTLMPYCFTEDRILNESKIEYTSCLSEEVTAHLEIKSTPCIDDKCGTYGRCYQYISGTLLFSTCSCSAGWRGWGCTDGTNALSYGQLLLSLLLLTLSNLLFIPAIVLAFYRRFYVEGIVYTVTMFSSALYHACDSELSSFCLVGINVLQYCDFFSAIVSFWVTLLVMANLNSTLRSIAHMVGTVGIAIGVEYDRTGLWVFAIPAGLGLLVLTASWASHCYKQHACYPRKKFWLTGMLPGILLATVGMVTYAFFETRKNYYYTHSIWHICMALTILCVLPERKRHSGKNQESINTCSYVRVEELSDMSPTPEPGVYNHLLTPSSP